MYLVRFANVYLTAGIRKKSKKECARKKLKKGKSNSYSSQSEKITKEKWERYLNKEDV